MDKINNLLQQVSIIQKKYDDLAEYSGEHYNVFDILGIRSDELSHSAILANLLNAKGRHGQKDLYLRLFIKTIINKLKDNESIEDESKLKFTLKLSNFDAKSSTAEKEKFAGKVIYEAEQGGRIDILINDGKNNIIIENKVYAGDQPQQLIRYNYFDNNAPILYLTLDGKEPSETSIKSKDIDKILQNGIHYTCISYQNEITSWLEKCIKEMANKPIIRETLNQYLFLIKSLTNQSNNNKMSEEITKTILSSKENFDSFRAIFTSYTTIANTIIKDNFIEFLKKFAEEKDLTIEIDEGFIRGEKYNGINLSNAKMSKKNIAIRFDFQSTNFRDALLGFVYINKGNIESYNYSKIINDFKSLTGKGQTSENFACYICPYIELDNMNTFNSLENLRFGCTINSFKNTLIQMLEIAIN